MDKVIINKHDEYRFLLTDTLPYETPLFFNNFGFYKILNEKSKLHKYLIDILTGKETYYPYNYYIKKGEIDFRTISIAHPAAQLNVCRLIHNNAEYVTYLCSKSNFSIRRPNRVASYYYEDSGYYNKKINKESFTRDDVEQQKILSDENYKEEKHATSYFSYDGYTLLYKFFNSLKFQSIEKKYNHFFRFDIAKCFNSIYTHSLSWSIKGKDFSKENINTLSFDGQFDKAIRNMNHGETNGIIIGPEFSRVFAEIILQKIDIETEIKLLKLGYKNKIDYEVKRYVDDYFIFTKKPDVAETIYINFKETLSHYKLFVNESKEHRDKRPFVTNLTIAKSEVSEVLNNFFKSIKKESNDTDENNSKEPKIQHIYKPYTRSNNLIIKFKSIVKKNNASYDAFSGLVLSIFRARLIGLLSEISTIDDKEKHSQTYKNLIILSLDFLFFIYTMSTRVRTSHLMSQILVIINKIIKLFTKSDQLEVEKKIRDELQLFMRLANENEIPKIEIINIIITAKTLFGSSIIDYKSILNLYNIEDSKSNFNTYDYFDITCILYLCCSNGDNLNLCSSIYKELTSRLITSKKPILSSELIHLLLDLGTFPYLDKLEYKKSLKIYLTKTYGKTPSDSNVNELFNLINRRRFFVDWRNEINIEKLLQRKEMQKGYD